MKPYGRWLWAYSIEGKWYWFALFVAVAYTYFRFTGEYLLLDLVVTLVWVVLLASLFPTNNRK